MAIQPVIAEAESFSEQIVQQTGRRLYLPHEIDEATPNTLSEVDLFPLQAVLGWLRGFIMKPHPALGRPGAVCPYVKSAIEESLLYLSVAQPKDPNSQTAIYKEMDIYSRMYKNFQPTTGPLANLRSIIVLFPHTAEGVFDDPPGLKRLKSKMMLRDITIGKFQPVSNPRQVLRDKFFPVQAPVPMYVMRPFADFDWAFIKGEAEWRAIYKQKFGAIPKDGF